MNVAGIKNLVEGAKDARNNARNDLRIAREYADSDPVFAAQYRKNAAAAWKRAYWNLDRAKIWKDSAQ